MVATEVDPVQAPTPPPSRHTSILPAAAVLGIAVVMLVIFGLTNLAESQRTTSTTFPTVVGTLRNDPSTTVFRGWALDGVPPANVASGLIAPVGARRIGSVATGGGGPSSGDYDLEVRVVVAAPRARLLGFYRSNLEATGWKLLSTTPTSRGGAELLLQAEGADGFYWEAGITATASSSTTTRYTYRLLQVADAS